MIFIGKDKAREITIKRLPKYSSSTEEFKSKKRILAKLYRKNNELKIKARRAIYIATRNKKITKLPCLKCKEVKVEAHHKDYTKPLEVIWLCKKYHTKLHKSVDL
jgi:hypothetical protein